MTIGAGASIGARSILYPNVVIGAHARIGEDCVVHAHVSIREGVVLGDRVIVQNGAVIGSDGFGFVKQPDGSHMKIPQTADVVIEDDVEIGANTTIDRPAIGETRIRAGTKVDNLVQIAHGVSVGRNALLAAQVGIAGSTTIEDDVVLAGQVGVSGHLRIGKGVVATAQTGIPNSVDAGAFISGYPAVSNREWLKSSAIFRQLPALKKRLAQLEARIAELEEKLTECRTRQDSLMRRAAAAPRALSVCSRGASPRNLRQPAPAGPDFLPRAQFHLSANALALSTEDQRFSWDAYFGGDVDIFDYVFGRTSVLADYHAVLGDEYRPFDPNQAYYDLEVSSSYRLGETEIVGVFHHVSRHLSDRPKTFAIAWNVAGVRLLRRVAAKGFTVDVRAGAGGIVQHSYVDYRWTADARSHGPSSDQPAPRAVRPPLRRVVHGRRHRFPIGARRMGASPKPGCESTVMGARWSSSPAASGGSTRTRWIDRRTAGASPASGC